MTEPRASGVENAQWKLWAHQWRLLGPPFRPSPEDLDIVRLSIKECSDRLSGEGLAALILGVTPEFAKLPWPAGTSLTALDQNPEMIRCVWPGSTALSERVFCGDWLEPPLSPRSFDIVIGDGVLSMLPFPEGYRRLAASVASLARPGATWNLRLFVRPDSPDPPEAVIDDLLANRIGSLHAFRLRLGMAMHGEDDSDGVCLADVWRYWEAAGVETARLVERGWPIEVIRIIDVYRDSPSIYSFPRLEAAVAVIAEFAAVAQISRATYELGERCPSVSFRFPA
jgi:hypothetical protein